MYHDSSFRSEGTVEGLRRASARGGGGKGLQGYRELQVLGLVGVQVGAWGRIQPQEYKGRAFWRHELSRI